MVQINSKIPESNSFKYKKFPKYVTTLIVSHAMFFANERKNGAIIQKIDNLEYVVSFREYSIYECLVFNGDELYDSYIMEYSDQVYKGKLISEWISGNV